MFYTGSEAVMECKIEGMAIEVIIDSGAGANMITLDTWNKLKEGNIMVKRQMIGSDRDFFAYGQQQPIKVVGSFEATVTVGKAMVDAMFYVVKHAKQNLLSKKTSEQLGVLKVGIINQLAMELKEFPKVNLTT